MSSSDDGSGGCSSSGTSQKRYRGVRRRKWGKWVSEIRVPGTQERLWLGTYSSPEAAAVAHDIAKYCLRENASLGDLNFPLVLPAGVQKGMSPRSVQKAASDAGMAIDAQFLSQKTWDSGVKSEPNSGNIPGTSSSVWQYYGDQDDCFSSSGASQNPNQFSRQGDHELNISVDDYL